MKFLTIILSLYIFALNLAPCADYDALGNDIKTEVSQLVDNDHQHQDSDLCSPFCICQCCHISTIPFDIPDLKLNTSFITTKNNFYQKGLEKDFTSSILQPPKA